MRAPSVAWCVMDAWEGGWMEVERGVRVREGDTETGETELGESDGANATTTL